MFLTIFSQHFCAGIMQWPSLPPTTLPTPENLTKDLAAFQKATAYFNNNGTDPEQQETQPDPELNAMWNKLVLLISNDTNGYKMTTVEVLYRERRLLFPACGHIKKIPDFFRCLFGEASVFGQTLFM